MALRRNALNKVLLNAAWLRRMVYAVYRINDKPIIVLGNQKAGTSAITALLGEATGLTYTIDVGGLRIPQLDEVHNAKRSLESYLKDRATIEFSRSIVKEANLTMLYPQLRRIFPNASFVFIVRDPRANIRSTLNRLDISGEKSILTPAEKDAISPIWQAILYNYWGSKAEDVNHMITSSARWKDAATQYLSHKDDMVLIRYEDFRVDKAAAIGDLAHRLGLDVVHDISGKVDIQFQPAGRQVSSWEEFFGEHNLATIEQICGPEMEQFGYSLSTQR